MKCEPMTRAELESIKRRAQKLKVESAETIRSAREEINDRVDNAVMKIIQVLAEN